MKGNARKVAGIGKGTNKVIAGICRRHGLMITLRNGLKQARRYPDQLNPRAVEAVPGLAHRTAISGSFEAMMWLPDKTVTLAIYRQLAMCWTRTCTMAIGSGWANYAYAQPAP